MQDSAADGDEQRAVVAQPIGRSLGVLLIGVEVGAEVIAPGRPVGPQQAMPAQQVAPRAAPSGPAPQRAVAPQVGHGLAQGVGQEEHGDATHPLHAPFVVAAQGLVQVEGGALVLGLFGAVPQPQGLQARLAAGQHLGVAQQPLGEQGGEVLIGGGDAQGVAHVGASQQLHARLGARRPVVHQAVFFDLCVEQRVDAAVCGLLAHEALYLRVPARALVLRQGLGAIAHGVDEELLAHREAHRQRVEPGGEEGVAAAPMARHGRLQIDEQAADGEVGHGSTGTGRYRATVRVCARAVKPVPDCRHLMIRSSE